MIRPPPRPALKWAVSTPVSPPNSSLMDARGLSIAVLPETQPCTSSGTLSTAEAISVVNSGLALAAHFGDGRLGAADVASGLIGAVVKDPVQDRIVWQEYLETA